MKIAWVAGGHIRDSSKYLEETKRNFIDVLNPDIYLHTYEGEDYNSIKNIIDIKEVKYEDPKISEFEIPDYIQNNRQLETNIQSCFFMWRKRALAIKMIQNEADYDCIVCGRIDVEYKHVFDINALQNINDSTILIPNGGDYRNGINDVIAIGNFKTMNIYSNLINKIYEYCREGCTFHPEHLLKYHLDKNKIVAHRFPMGIVIRGRGYN